MKCQDCQCSRCDADCPVKCRASYPCMVPVTKCKENQNDREIERDRAGVALNDR